MCTSIIVGKEATKDGTIILARNEDFGVNNWNKYLKYRKTPQYAEISSSDKWVLGNGLEVDIPKKSYSYCSIPDAEASKEATKCVGDHYFFEERGINECNVAISATNSMDMNSRVKELDPPVEIGIEESIILTLILPQVSKAVEAVELLGNYVENYGASEANGILIADEEEAWYFEIGSCHHWIAVKVPDKSYLVISNCMRVHSVDLNSKGVKCSKKLFDFVKNNKLLKNPECHNFNFAKAFGYSGSLVDGTYDKYYNVDRIWLAQSILSPSNKQQPRLEEYPMFLEPDKKLKIDDIMKVLRADYWGTELMSLSTRPIGAVRTAESHIMAIDSKMPDKLKGIIWQTISTPLGAPYMPVFAITDNIPECYSNGESEYTPLSAYWIFRSLFSLADMCEESVLEKLWCDYEKQLIESYEKLKQELKALKNKDEEKAVNIAKNYSTNILCDTVKIANDKLNKVITQIAVKQKDKCNR